MSRSITCANVLTYGNIQACIHVTLCSIHTSYIHTHIHAYIQIRGAVEYQQKQWNADARAAVASHLREPENSYAVDVLMAAVMNGQAHLGDLGSAMASLSIVSRCAFFCTVRVPSSIYTYSCRVFVQSSNF